MARRGRRRRLRDGHGRRPAHPPLPRAARRRGRRAGEPQCSGSSRSTRCSSSATRASGSPPTSGRTARSTRAATSCSSSFDLEDGVPRWRWQVGGIVLERELAMAHGPSAVGVVHRLVSRRPAGAPRADAALHLAERARRAASRTARRRSSRRPDGFVFEERLPRRRRRAGRPGGEWYRGVRAREEAARGLSDREDLWAAGDVRAPTLEPGAVPRGDRRRRAVRRDAAGGDARSSPARDGAARSGCSRPRARPTRSTRSSCSRPTSSRSRPAGARPRSPAIRGSASGRAT